MKKWTQDKLDIIRMYLENGSNYQDISKKLNLSYDAIEHAVRRHDLKQGIESGLLFEKTKAKLKKEDITKLARLIGENLYKNYKKIKLEEPQTKKTKGKMEEMSILDLSDIHIGMINEVFDSTKGKKVTTYNMNIFKKELLTLQTSIAEIHSLLSNAYSLKELTIFCLGDIITNDRIFPTQTFEIEKVVGLQIWDAVNYLTKFINNLLSLYEKITFVGVVGNHGRCFDSDTRVLTKAGWKYYNKIKKNEIVATYNMKDKKIEWQQIMDRHVYHNEPRLCVTKTKTADIRVTPDHEMVYKTHEGKIAKKYAKNLWVNEILVIPTTAPSKNKEYNISDDYLKLLGWILTDGGILQNNGYISLYQSKENYVKEIKALLRKLKIKYTLDCRQRDIKSICGKKLKNKPKKQYTFRILAKSSYKINKILKLNKTRKLPTWGFALSDRQVRVLLKSIIKGDGNIKKKRMGKDGYIRDVSYTIWGTKEFLETLQGLLLTHNISCSVNEQRTRLGSHYLMVRKNKFIEIDGQKTTVDYNGTVWCVSVPNGTLIVERNGKPFICGNSGILYDEPVQNNFEYFLYRILERQFKASDRVKIIVPETRRYIHTIYGWKHMIEHGDNMRGSSSNAIERQIKEIALNVGGFDIYHMGHFHKLSEREIADKIIVKHNGSFIEKDSYGFNKFKTYSTPKQWFFGCNKTRVETWNFKIDLRG